jgi:hypothetical protein
VHCAIDRAKNAAVQPDHQKAAWRGFPLNGDIGSLPKASRRLPETKYV